MSMEATVKNLTEDGSIIRAENHYWVFYINNETAPTLVDRKCGKSLRNASTPRWVSLKTPIKASSAFT